MIAHDGTTRELTDEPIGANEKRVKKEMDKMVLPSRAKIT